MAEAGWSDERPNDHDRAPALSRIAPCGYCGHNEHPNSHCGALVDLRVVDIFCPCRCPVPGFYA